MTSIQKILLIGILCLVAHSAWAQPNLPSEEVEVIKDFEANLEESEKLVVEPGLPPLDTANKNLVYDIPSRTVKLEYLPPKIRPLAMRRQRTEKTYNGFAKLGVGIPNSILGELGYHISDPERYSFTGRLHHHSANNDRRRENQRFANSGGRLQGEYYLDSGLAVGGYLGFRSNQVHFYGYDDESVSFTRDAVRQNWNLFDVGVKAYNGERTLGDINYNAAFNLYRLTDNYAAGETGVDLQLGGTKWFDDKHPLSLTIITDFTTYDDTVKQRLNNFFFQPNFTFHGNGFKIKAGVNIASHNDDFFFFPDAEVAVNIVGNRLAAFAGAGGGLQKNNLRNLSEYNPFISTFARLNLQNTNYFHYYGGLRGSLGILDYQVEAGYKDARNLALFLNDPQDSLRFQTLYDTVRIFTFKGTITAEPIEGLRVIASVGQNIYNLEKEDKPWHLPALVVNLGLRYRTFEDRLTLKANAFIENGVPYLTPEGVADNLNALFDLSVGAHYRFSQNFGAFLDLNNLASNNRQRWFRYPVYGINILAGVTARF
ncbi:MAG: hypothetical protein AAFW73_13745 [Bacteroidota bacterium]